MNGLEWGDYFGIAALVIGTVGLLINIHELRKERKKLRRATKSHPRDKTAEEAARRQME
jgi:hypothetical protein